MCFCYQAVASSVLARKCVCAGGAGTILSMGPFPVPLTGKAPTRAAPLPRPCPNLLCHQIKYDTTATISLNTIVAQLNMQQGKLKEAKELLDECNEQVSKWME